MNSLRSRLSIAALLVCALLPLTTLQAQTDLHWTRFKERKALERDPSHLAVLVPQGQMNAILQGGFPALSIASGKIERHAVAGWLMIDVGPRTPEAMDALVEALAEEPAVQFASPVLIDDLGGPMFLTPHVMASFTNGTPAAQREAAIRQGGFAKVDEFTSLNIVRLASSTRNGLDLLSAANDLASRSDVVFAEPDMIFTGTHDLVPNDPQFSSLWGLRNTGAGTVGIDMHAVPAWDISIGSTSIITVVFDSGIQQDHPDMHQVAGSDFTTDAGDGGPVGQYDNHGTAVGGCISATINNSLGVVGIAPNTYVASARIGTGYTAQGTFSSQASWTVNAINWATTIGARVTNNSNSYGFTSGAVQTAYTTTRTNGMVHFASAGNDGLDQLGYPSSLSVVNAVSANTQSGTLASFSNYNSGLSVCAPGVSVATTDRTGALGYSTGDYATVQGTSFSSPYAAGVTALLLSVAPTLTAAQAETILQNTATDLGTAGFDDQFGHGMVNAYAALADVVTLTGPCTTVSFSTAMEPITYVDFAGINNPTCTAVGCDAQLADHTSFAGNVAPGGSYTITVNGNSDGNYTNYYTAFFDWDQDFLFEDAQPIGFITNSNGVDIAKRISATMNVPMGALPGTTRMRLIKAYADGTAQPPPHVNYPADPCGTYGYGQAEDYTLNVVVAACTGDPAPGNTTGPASSCADTPFTLGLTNATSGTGVSYTWYFSTNGGANWTPFGGNASTQSASITQQTWFKANVACSASGQDEDSGPLMVDLSAPVLPEPWDANGVVDPNCWTTANTAPTWNAANGYAVGGGSGSVKFDFWNLSTNTNATIVSPILPTPTTAGQRVGFDVAGAKYTNTAVDTVKLEASTNGGGTWILVQDLTNEAIGALNTVGVLGSVFTPSSAGQWATREFVLPAGTNRVRFRGVSAYGNNVYLDNVDILPSLACDPPAVTVTTVPACPGGFNVSVDFTDFGDGSQATVAYSINGTPQTPVTVTSTGITLLPGFLSGDDVDVTIEHETDDLCDQSFNNVTYSCPPANDVCSGAIAIPITGPFPYTTAAIPLTNATDTDDPITSCQANSHKGLWFTFSPPVTGSYTISACQSEAPSSTVPDNILGIYTAADCAGPFNEVDCDDDDCTTLNLQAVVTATLNCGTTYYILASAFNNSTGDIQLHVTAPTCAVTAYDMTGGGAYCDGGPGVTVGLNGSDLCTDYQLFVGAVPLNTLAGTGSALDFGLQTIAGTYTVVATNATFPGCTGTMNGSAAVSIQALPNAGSNGAITICETTTLTEGLLFGALGGSPDAGGSWSPVPNGAGTYTYTVNATAPCTGTATAQVQVNVQAAPNAGSNNTATVCETTTIDEALLFGLLGGSPDAGGSWSPVPSGAGTYTYTVNAIAPCTGSASAEVQVNIQAAPNAGNNGAITICETTTLTEGLLFGALGGSPDPGGSWSPAPAGAGTYTYTVNATAPCTGTATAQVQVNVQAAPNAGSNNTATVCETTTIDEALLFGLLGGSPDAGGSWSPVPSGAGTYTYTVNAIAPCTGSASAEVQVDIQAAPNAGSNGAITICETTTLTEGLLFGALGGSPDPGGSWSPAPAGAGTYTYTVNATAPCTGSATAQVQVNVQAAPNAGSNGTLTICPGGTVNEAQLFAALGGSPAAGGIWSPIPNGAGTYTYTVDATPPCSASGSAQVVVSEGGTDGDGDGVVDCVDNCPSAANPGQEDSDGDGEGDVCDSCPLALPGIANFDVNTCACELGYFATITDIGGNNVITACTICPPGTACPDGISSIPCPAGSFSNLPGQSVCSACPAGSFSSTIGSVACTACAEGYFNGSVAATSCQACPAGSFSANTGATECESCAAGYFSGVEAATSCTACPAGSFSAAVGATECESCAAGYFSGVEAATSCTACPAGSFSSTTGSTECESCPPGTYNPIEAASFCQSCPPGSFNGSLGATACELCPVNTYNPASGAEVCLACPNGETSGIGAIACTPSGACTNYILELQSGATAPGAVTYEVLDETGTSTVLSGNNPIPANSIGTLTLCLNDGCYQLRVTDGAGDGLLGYVLREMGANGRRMIDNAYNMNDGVSQIASGGTFCVPMGNDRPIHSSCDKLDWVNNKFIVCHANAAVTAEYGVTNTTSGYEFWFFDPNGSYSFRRFRSHATSDGTGSGALRACHFKINGWFSTVTAPHIPANILLNVRVRGRVAGTNLAFGPACQFKIDPVLAACPRVKLQDDPANTSDYSCGVSRDFGGASNPSNRIYANPPQPIPVVASSAVRYQFRFRITGENVCIVRPPQQSARMVLNWTNGTPLECSKTYEVDVRVSLDGGATWCFGPAGSSEAAACADSEAWGKLCLVTINPCAEAAGGGSSLAVQGDGEFTLYPNPNRGDQLYLNVSKVQEGVNTMNVDIYDLTGKRVLARTIAVQDGFVKTNLDLNGDLSGGMYLVNITAGDKTYTERLVIQP